MPLLFRRCRRDKLRIPARFGLGSTYQSWPGTTRSWPACSPVSRSWSSTWCWIALIDVAATASRGAAHEVEHETLDRRCADECVSRPVSVRHSIQPLGRREWLLVDRRPGRVGGIARWNLICGFGVHVVYAVVQFVAGSAGTLAKHCVFIVAVLVPPIGVFFIEATLSDLALALADPKTREPLEPLWETANNLSIPIALMVLDRLRDGVAHRQKTAACDVAARPSRTTTPDRAALHHRRRRGRRRLSAPSARYRCGTRARISRRAKRGSGSPFSRSCWSSRARHCHSRQGVEPAYADV